jgi:predicted Rossmann fold flavoprotein
MAQSNPPFDLLVIGGGAAGFFCALACADACPQARIVILEKARAVLAKVRISGGGRCNLTQAQFDPAVLAEGYPRGGKAMRQLLARFQPRDTLAWFEQRGVALKTEADGRVFPQSNRSQTVIDLLLAETTKHAIDVRTLSPVANIRAQAAGVSVETGGALLEARFALLATGGEKAGFTLAQSLGHAIEPPAPSLFTFKLDDARIQGLAGLSVADVEIRLPEANLRQRGALLVTDWGFSGPAALKLSAWGARFLHQQGYRAELRINWLAGMNQEQVLQTLTARRADESRRIAFGRSPFAQLPLRLWQRLASAAGISETAAWSQLSNQRLTVLVAELCNGQYTIHGKGEFKDEFVTCGGVRLEEIDLKTMRSRIQPGLYFAGEVLDIDGITGGYNFQNAWTTAWIAGNAIAGAILAGESR